MDKLIPTFTDISEWNINVYINTGGTRSKQIAVHPETDKEYFFKGSKVIKDTNEIRYPTEFWSEIVSSKIGQYLGFKMLDYNIGYSNKTFQKIGCLSQSMVEHSQNRLTEGVTYLTGANSKYKPSAKEDKVKYTFQFITKALIRFEMSNYISNIIEIIIFDAIVGNSDRHQENWGVINYFQTVINEIDNDLKDESLGWFVTFVKHLTKAITENILDNHKKEKKISRSTLIMQSSFIPSDFAPIYDSGCCLGREIEEERLNKMLLDNNMLQAYVRKGESEIHWEGFEKKKKHFELINLVKEMHKDQVCEIIDRVVNKFKKEDIQSIIFNIDRNIPPHLSQYKLADNRKELMNKIINLRIEKLKEIR